MRYAPSSSRLSSILNAIQSLSAPSPPSPTSSTQSDVELVLVGAIALFSAAISDSAATAAIITLAFTISSWVLDFAIAGQPGVLDWIARLSLTQTLRTFEQGLLSAGLVVGMVGVICGFSALATVWLPPGVATRTKLVRSALCLLATAIA